MSHPTNGIAYHSRHDRTSFYDKYQQSRHPDAQGVLRMERSLRNPKKIARKFGVDTLRLSDPPQS